MMMDRADVTLGFLLAYIVAAALHAGLAASIQRRGYRAAEVRVFATANWMLAAWHVLQGIEYTQTVHLAVLGVAWMRALFGLELLVEATTLALFLQLFATFERTYRRQAPSLRAAITSHVHRRRRIYVPLGYAAVVVGMGLYFVDSTGTGGFLEELRSHIGPTSAYLFGGTLLFMVFVLFPARPGQERIPVPAIGRALLLLSLAITLGLIAIWHDDHPRRVSLALIPWLNLQSVAFCIFLAFLRYEFSFLDHYIEAVLRFLTWSVVVLVAYFAFNRLSFPDWSYGRYATSLSRIGVLLAAVALAPGLGRAVSRWGERVFFGRDVSVGESLRLFARRLGRAHTLADLVEGSGRDLAREFHARVVHVVVGEKLPEEFEPGRKDTDIRLRLPLRHDERIVGWLLMGERRNLYPYFETELRHLGVVAELLAKVKGDLDRGRSSPGTVSSPEYFMKSSGSTFLGIRANEKVESEKSTLASALRTGRRGSESRPVAVDARIGGFRRRRLG